MAGVILYFVIRDMDAYHAILKCLDIRNAIKLASCNTFWGDVVRTSPHKFTHQVEGDVGNYSFRRILNAYGPRLVSLKLRAGSTCFASIQRMLDSCPSLTIIHIELAISNSFVRPVTVTPMVIPLYFKRATHVRIELVNPEMQFYDMEVLPILEIRGMHVSTLEVTGVYNVHIDQAPSLNVLRIWGVASVTSASPLTVTSLALVRVGEWDTVLTLANECPGVSGRHGPLEAPNARHITIVAEGNNPWNPDIDETMLNLKGTRVETLILHNADVPPGHYPFLKKLERDRDVKAYEFEGVMAPLLDCIEIDSTDCMPDADNIRDLNYLFPSLKHVLFPSL